MYFNEYITHINSKSEGSFLVLSYLAESLVVKNSYQPVKTLWYGVGGVWESFCWQAALRSAWRVVAPETDSMTASSTEYERFTSLVLTMYASALLTNDTDGLFTGEEEKQCHFYFHLCSIITIKANTDSLSIWFHDSSSDWCRHLPLIANLNIERKQTIVFSLLC